MSEVIIEPSVELSVEPVKELKEVSMEVPITSEKDGFQLETINNYGTKTNNMVENGGEDGGASARPTVAPLSATEEVQDDDFIDPDNLGLKEKVLLRIFPFILRFPWLRNKILKKKEEEDKCEMVYIDIIHIH